MQKLYGDIMNSFVNPSCGWSDEDGLALSQAGCTRYL